MYVCVYTNVYICILYGRLVSVCLSLADWSEVLDIHDVVSRSILYSVYAVFCGNSVGECSEVLGCVSCCLYNVCLYHVMCIYMNNGYLNHQNSTV